MSFSTLARERYISLRRKYPVQKRALDGFSRVMRALTRKPPARSVYVEIVDGAQQQV